jgi:hypothetical protein
MSNGPEIIRDETVIDPPIMLMSDPPSVVAPVVAGPVVAGPVVAGPVVAPASTVRSTSVRSIAPDAVIASIAGLALTIVGLLAITRGGLDGPLDQPVVQVVGFSHTTLLGMIETVLGVGLLISGASRSRGATLFFGVLIGIGAFVGAVQTKSFVEPLALERNYCWLLLAGAAIVVLTALLIPRASRRSNVVTVS